MHLFDFRKKGRIKNANSTMPLDSYLFFVIVDHEKPFLFMVNRCQFIIKFIERIIKMENNKLSFA